MDNMVHYNWQLEITPEKQVKIFNGHIPTLSPKGNWT
jgi:hypothetical protein